MDLLFFHSYPSSYNERIEEDERIVMDKQCVSQEDLKGGAPPFVQ